MLSQEIQQQLTDHSIAAASETELREALEEKIETYTLFKLAPWPSRRWKCHYRIMTRDQFYDGQSAEDAYALALLAQISQE